MHTQKFFFKKYLLNVFFIGRIEIELKNTLEVNKFYFILYRKNMLIYSLLFWDNKGLVFDGFISEKKKLGKEITAPQLA